MPMQRDHTIMLYTVWVGGTEVNYSYFDDIHEAKLLARKYTSTGYTDVYVEEFNKEEIERDERSRMPMPRDYTIIMRDLIENEVLDPKEVLFNLLNWMPEDDVYEFSQDEYDVATNAAYKEKYQALNASNEEVRDD